MITGGKKLVSQIPAFSSDGKKLLICTGNTVSIFSTTTSFLISELEGHAAPVTSVIVVRVSGPATKIVCNCWTSSLDGTIRYWDFSSGELIKTVEVCVPIFSMVIPKISVSGLDDGMKFPNLFACISVRTSALQGDGNDNKMSISGQVRVVNLTKSVLIGGQITEVNFKNKEEKYKFVWDIVDKRWEHQMHRPLHAAALYLNPGLYYDNKQEIEYNPEIKDGLFHVITILSQTMEEPTKVSSQLANYRQAIGPFGMALAIQSRKEFAPAEWWVSFGYGCRELQRIAIRVLSLTCSATPCERNWSTFEMTSDLQPLVVSSSGDFFGLCSVNKLLIWKVPTKDFHANEVRKIKLHHTKKLTILAFHPTERIVAGGDITGRILIWRGFGNISSGSGHSLNKRLNNVEYESAGVRDNDDADSCSTWHWHANAVKVLSFSSDGAYLFSGGKEGVLVCWQLETEKKTFLPRVGSQLLYFVQSPNLSLSCISCADNQIHILKMPSMEILKPITGIKLAYSMPEAYKGIWGNQFDISSNGVIALLSENYDVQFYHLFHNREISKVHVCERNYQPGDGIKVVLPLLALSSDASIMGTVEIKLPEEDIGGLLCLKFWERSVQDENYSLSTVIYEPHGDAGISALAFHPTRSMAVSSSYGGDFKIWVSCSYDEMFQKFGWKCQSVGSYKKKPMTAAGFSKDGSVLAIAAETSITLWNPETNALIAVVGETLTPIVQLLFMPKSDKLVTISHDSKPQLSLWDLSKLSLTWSYQLFVEAVACGSKNSEFAVLLVVPTNSQNSAVSETLCNRDGLVLLFQAEKPIPVATWSVKKAKGGGLAFVPTHLAQNDDVDTGCSRELLTYINGDHEYIIFDPYSTIEDQTAVKLLQHRTVLEEEGAVGYESIYGKLPPVRKETKNSPTIPFMSSDKPWETLFDGPSHILPPLPKLCSELLASLLEKRTNIL